MTTLLILSALLSLSGSGRRESIDLGVHNGPVRFAESRNTIPADLLGKKNTVPAEKTS